KNMYSIDTIPMTTYGWHISSQSGTADLPEMKEQVFTAYGKEGYQITTHRANELDSKGLILANSLVDFKTKTNDLYNVFPAPGVKVVKLEAAAMNCFAKDGFKIENVCVFSNAVYARFNINLI